ncbi:MULTISPECIES: hypothetical protein [unclassified Pseudonocardia]|uniref:hypothetical protein n=1 Tax=unclassified Pseudonocardia TaxID=2619320 RepID=UPI0011153281|nr:hypothetical protein [Pseudonocardia sp. Ae707_Ps1]
MSAMPSSSGPERPDPGHGSSRHSHRAAEPEAVGSDESGDGSWFTVVLRGYDRSQVDTRLADLDHRIHEEIRRAESAERALAAARAQMRRLQEQVEAGAADASDRRAEEAGFGRRVERVLQAAEQEATELRERAAAEADEIVARARAEADDRRTRTEEALLGRAATLDREFTSRSTALDEREEAAASRERGLAERERTVDERFGSARSEAEKILATARSEADDVLSGARDEAASALRDAERDAGAARDGVTRDVERLASLRDQVRGELTRVREALSAELDREPVAAALDDALFGPSATPGTGDDATGAPAGAVASVSELGSARGAAFVWSSGTGADRTPPTVTDEEPAAGDPADDAPGDGAADDADSPSASATGEPADTTGDTATGTLLLGPGRRPGGARRDDDDPDSTTVGQIPPISLTSIGVLPFGELGAGRDNARTRTDGANGASRPQRGPTRGPGPGRRSR